MAYSVDTASRVTGLASGIDTDSMVKELMAAERLPLDKMEQKVSWTTWQRDSYRDMNKMFYDLDQQALDMKFQKTFQSKTTASTNEAAVTATATATATNSSYSIGVKELATTAINVSTEGISSGATKINQFGKLSEQNFGGTNITGGGSFDITYFDETGKQVPTTINYTADDTLNSVLKKIGTETGNEIRATYDTQSDKIIIERTKSGNFNTTDTDGSADVLFSGNEIGFDVNGFLGTTLKLAEVGTTTIPGGESGGTDARFTYNGVEFTSKDNSYTLNDVTFNFTSVTTTPTTITIDNNVDAAYDKIKAFIDKYNETIETVNTALQESRYRDYKPLTEAQKAELSDTEIEQWEEKSKSGLLKGDTTLSSGLSSMRSSWYGTVDNSSNFDSITDIGITTSSNYLDRGKLEINEADLKAALREDSESVHRLFSNNVEGSGRGIINRLEDSIANTIKSVEARAGKSTSTSLQQDTLGRQLESMEDRISAFEDRLVSIEDRYWRQFGAMEKMIQQMNSQSSYLSQQFSY